MISAVQKAANAISGKTARACDGCLIRRARWYCAADDAFLCQACDASVHSANQLATRHERIRLQTASFSSSSKWMNLSPAPAWHGRKPRTPRRNKNKNCSVLSRGHNSEEKDNGLMGHLMEPVVPEMGREEGSIDDENEFDEQMMCRVPIFDPFEAGFCNDDDQINGDMKVDLLEGFNEFLPSDLDLAEFAADVESLLGAQIEDGPKAIEIATNNNVFDVDHKVTVKTEADAVVSSVMMGFRYGPPVITGKGKEAEEEKVFPAAMTSTSGNGEGEATHQVEMKRERLLSLNYESVITAWASHGSPWTTGTRPEFKPGVCWPEFPECYDPINGGGGRRSDGEREARVSRYREKRRTRLFSKKIRYEVRKLNAEKRPRMKGRFVKRTSAFMGDFTRFSVY